MMPRTPWTSSTGGPTMAATSGSLSMLAGLDLIGAVSGEDVAGVAVVPATAGGAEAGAGRGPGAGAGRGAGGAEVVPGIERGTGVTRETERGRDRGRAAGAAEDEKSYTLALFYSVPAFLLNLNVVFKQLCSNFTFGNICPRFFVNFTGLLKSFHFEQG